MRLQPPMNDAQLLKILRAAEPDTTIATLVADLRANKWRTPSALAWHFGYKHRDAPAFTNAIYKFLLWKDDHGERWMRHAEWMSCFFSEAQHGA